MRFLALTALVVTVPALAQRPPSPLFGCEIERALDLLAPTQPERQTIHSMVARGFIVDFAAGMLRWRVRADGSLTNPTQWTVAQRGDGSNDWVAARGLHDTARGDQQVLRVRTWGEDGIRFALFDGLGYALVGTCR